jgi:glycosyltransferase involved in cell wall biosynthesis
MFDMATGLRDRGHQVAVLTCYPRYNLTKEDRAFQRPAKWKNESIEKGIEVVRVDAKGVHNTGPFLRGVAFLMLPLLFRRAGAALDRVDAIIHYSPPLTLGVSAVWLKKRFEAVYIMNVQDIFPQNAIDLGVLRNKGAIAFFHVVEDYCYRNADCITCHSQGNAVFLTNKPGNGGKVRVVYNWVDPGEYRVQCDGSVRERLGLDGRFIVFFGGVMGFAQDLRTVVECARLLRNRREIWCGER